MSSDDSDERASSASFSCPAPAVETERILLGHGAGGRLSQRLLEELILPAFANPFLDRRDDQAVLPAMEGRLAFTTDSYVVTPLFFPGSDIGRLAVHGTVNDLAMAGAHPRFLSLSFILEEGLPIKTLRAVVLSIKDAARSCGVQIVTGDTKVVNRGSADQMFINTAGLGVVPAGVELSAQYVRPGDAVLLSGTLADHGMAILAARDGLGLDGMLISDCAPLHGLVQALIGSGVRLRCLRDPTRGGLAAALTEIASRAGVGIDLDESRLPLGDAVRGACEILGIDPLFVANEGKLVAFVEAADAELALAALRAHPLGKDAAIIGHATPTPGEIVVHTSIGGHRFLELPLSTPLPRIC
jgi:hydrogenase expression/formation protein HypE